LSKQQQYQQQQELLGLKLHMVQDKINGAKKGKEVTFFGDFAYVHKLSFVVVVHLNIP